MNPKIEWLDLVLLFQCSGSNKRVVLHVKLMKTWKRKRNGMAQFLAIYLLTLLGGYYLFGRYTTQRYGGTIEENITMGLILYFPILITALILPSIWIIKKKRVRKIQLTEASQSISFEFSKTRKENKLLENISYDLQESNHFTALTFYYRTKATRGHWLYFKAFSILAPSLSVAWKRRQLREVADRLRSNGVLKRSGIERGSFWSHLFD